MMRLKSFKISPEWLGQDDEDFRQLLDDDKQKIIEELNNLGTIKRIFRDAFRKLLYYYTFDPFLIYKEHFKNASLSKYRIYQCDKLKIKTQLSDKHQIIWRRIFYSWIFYICSKLSILFLLQINLDSKMKDTESNAKTRPKLALLSVANFIGNPFIDSPNVTRNLFPIIVIIFIYGVVYIPMRYLTRPMNSNNMRLYFEPIREVERIDIELDEMIGELIHTISESMKPSYSLVRIPDANRPPNGRVLYGGRQSGASPSSLALGDLSIAGLRYPMQIRTMVENGKPETLLIGLRYLRNELWKLRPVVYTSRWFVWFHAKLILTSFLSALICLPVFFLVTFWILDVAVRDRIADGDESTRPKEMSVIERWTLVDQMFSWQEILLLIELGFTVLVALIAVMSMMIVQSLNVMTEIWIIETMRLDLKQTIAHLKVDQGFGLTLEASEYENEPQFSYNPELKLAKTLIRLRMSIKELRNISQFLSEFISINLVIVFCNCKPILSTGNIEEAELSQIRLLLVAWLWGWCNLTLISCAFGTNSAMKLDKLAWSLVACLVSRCMKGNRKINDDPMICKWIKFVASNEFGDKRNQVRPFGMGLTFKKTLQLNFLVISLIPFLRQYKF